MKHLLLLSLSLSALPLAAPGQEEKPFAAFPEYTAKPFMDEEEVGKRKVVQLKREEIDSIATFVQGFFKAYNPKPLAEVLADPKIGDYLTADFVKRMSRAQRAAKLSGEQYFAPGHSDWNDLYKYYGALTTESPGQYIIDFAVGSTKNDEATYEHHIWIIVKKEGTGWRISDLRDMGNG
jgi:hypothetical protein